MTSSEEEVKTVEIIINLSLDDQAWMTKPDMKASQYKHKVTKQ